MHPIIDTHQHLWNLNQFSLPWLEGAPALAQSYLSSDYLVATEGKNVVKTVYMEVDVAPDQRAAEAEHLIALCQQADNPTSAAVIGGAPDADDFRDYLTRFKDSPYIKGVRQVLHVPDSRPGRCLEPAFVENVQWLGENGLSFDLCMRPSELLDGAKLAEQCPRTQFILDHCGNADPHIVSGSLNAEAMDKDDPFWHDPQYWKEAIVGYADHKNVVCKISGIIAHTREGWHIDDLATVVNHCLDSFGPDRVIFGGDWPVCTLAAPLAEWISTLQTILATRSEADQRKLLHDNAQRLFGLE